MSEGFSSIFRGIRPVDWVLAGALTALGVVADGRERPDLATPTWPPTSPTGTMVHEMTSHSWAMVPVFALATVPVLWWRRNVIAVTAIALAVMVLHDLLFGWVTRCGAGLPLAFVLAYLGAVVPRARGGRGSSLGLTTLLTAAVLVVDATTGFEPIVLALPIVLIVFGIGRAVRHRTAMSAELRGAHRRAPAAARRAGRPGGRRRPGPALPPARRAPAGAARPAHRPPPSPARTSTRTSAKALFESIESDSRATLDGMREIVGLLRGGDVALAPAPTVAHLDALLARHTGRTPG